MASISPQGRGRWQHRRKAQRSDGTRTALLGQYTSADFALSADGHGGTVITAPTSVHQSNMLAAAA